MRRLSIVAVTALVIAVPTRQLAQIRVAPGASLDVQVPAPPVPVVVGGRTILAYELHITNFRTVDVTLTRIDVAAKGRSSPLATYQDADLRAALGRVGVRPDGRDARTIAPGMRVVCFVWLAAPATVPPVLTHRIAIGVPDGDRIDTAIVEAPPTDVRKDTPAALDAPLRGGPWAAVYDPSMPAGHRRALFAIDGRARIPARFAIDWIKLDDEGRASNGTGQALTNHYGYGEDVLAVADGLVVDAVDRYDEPTVPVTLANASGNSVTLQLDRGRFVSYEHLKRGSINVRVGERVRPGQVVAAVGASGSVASGPHLHFHVSDANSPLGAEGLPFVLRQFTLIGQFDSIEAFGRGQKWEPAAGTIRMELPRQQAVLRFDVIRP